MPKSQDSRNTRRYIKHYSSFFQGVYTEFVGERTLPKALRTRPTIFIFGEDGVGKTIVARHILGEGHRLMKRQEVLDIFLLKIRRRRWMDDISSHPKLILESPSFLRQRPLILEMLQSLIKLRNRKGLQTILLDAEDCGPVREIVQSTELKDRATIMLRFPFGRGRYRFLAHVCRLRGLPVKLARELSTIEPWTYKAVFDHIEQVEAGQQSVETRSESEEQNQ